MLHILLAIQTWIIKGLYITELSLVKRVPVASYNRDVFIS